MNHSWPDTKNILSKYSQTAVITIADIPIFSIQRYFFLHRLFSHTNNDTTIIVAFPLDIVITNANISW
jgi:hypothetical protein